MLLSMLGLPRAHMACPPMVRAKISDARWESMRCWKEHDPGRGGYAKGWMCEGTDRRRLWKAGVLMVLVCGKEWRRYHTRKNKKTCEATDIIIGGGLREFIYTPVFTAS